MRRASLSRVVVVVAAAAAVVLCASRAARADEASQSLVEGVKAGYAEMDYAGCKEGAQDALTKPAARAERIDALKYLGLCAAALGDADTARDAFTRMLVVDRDAVLPPGLSPRFTSAFREAKGALLDTPKTGFTVESDEKDGRVRVVRVAVVDPTEVVVKVAFRGEGGVTSPGVRAAARLELELPGEGEVSLLGLDEAGGEVTVLVLPPIGGAPAAVATAAPAAPPPDDGLGAVLLWSGVGATALVLVAAAVAGGVALAFAPPSRVSFKSGVVFGDE